MGLFSGLTSSGEPMVPMDDNAAVADASANPYLSVVVPQVRAAYDTMYDAVKYVLIGKNASLKQIDKWIARWEESLDRIAKKYEEILQAFDDKDAAFQGMFTFDILQEAWDILQDFPILRRYMGEANYWALYDALGLLATQAGSVAADLSTALKEAIKAAIRALLAMTDGLMSLESYLGMITQYWGALYVKTIPLAMLDSIVPNVTCAYHYKKTQTSQINGTTVDNPVPGPAGFVPLPVPIPDPAYAATHFGSELIPDLNDPTTWVTEDGRPKFINIDAMRDALAYWGSSYTNEELPLVSMAYPRRPYLDQEGNETSHPLTIGKTLAQLDTSLNQMAAGVQAPAADIDPFMADEQVREHFDEFLDLFRRWQAAFKASRDTVCRLLDRIPTPMTQIEASLYRRHGTAATVSDKMKAASVGITSLSMLDVSSKYDRVEAQNALDAYLDAIFGTHGSTVYSLRPNPEFLTGKVREALRDIFKLYAEIHNHSTDDDKELFRYGQTLVLALGQATVNRAKSYTAADSRLTLAASIVPVFGRITVPKSDPQRPESGTLFVRSLDSRLYLLDTSQTPRSENQGLQTYDCEEALGEASSWVALPYFNEIPDDPFGVYERSLVLPVGYRALPVSFRASDHGQVVHMAEDTSQSLGEFPKALESPAAWHYAYRDDAYSCAYFPHTYVSDTTPTTVISKYLKLVAEKEPEEQSLDEEIAEAVGYSILKGREVYAACFGVYGNLLKMASWNFKSMTSAEFDEMYARVGAGSDLFYEKANPSQIVFKHSSFYSVTMNTAYTIYHGAMATENVTRGPENYQFLVFPCESISLHKIRQGSLDEAWPVDAEGPDGSQYHYITMRNAVPKCPKYVDPYKWSIIDIIHELYLLIWGISPLCGDNGDRQAKLEDALKDFGLTPPDFVGQLPGDGDGELANFKITLFDKYATRIKELVDSIYNLRAQILATTEAW